MAKVKDKKKDKALSVRRITDKKQRNTGGFWMRLKTDEWMKAYALFTPDPETDDNPGWFEYQEHYDKTNNQYVPCTEEDCYMCELGHNPSVRALSLWYFPDNANGEKLKVLKLNGYMIRDFAEIEAEEGGVLGKRFRVKRLSDKGEYRVSPQSDKPLKKSEIKALIKSALSKEANENKGSTNPLDFAAITLRQLKAALEKNDAVSGMTDVDDDDDDDDDDTEEEEETTSKKGKEKKSKEKDDSDDDDDDDDDDDEESDDDDDESDDDDDDDDEKEEDDDDDDESDDDDDEKESDDDDDDEEEETDAISGQKFTVVSTKEAEEVVTVKMDDKNTKLWIGEGVEADWDVVKKGAEITVDAETDDEGDWIITKLKVKKSKDGDKKKSKGGKKK